MSKPEKLLSNMAQYYNGTNEWHKHLFGFVYTDGARDVAEEGEAYWFLDLIVSHAVELHKKGNNFLVFKLQLDEEGNGAMVTIEDGNENKLGEQKIEYTDFPAMSQTLWCINGTILLPEEY
jgi:hypothetical protein